MMAVLMPFNYADSMTLNDLRDFTQLADKDLRKQLQMLVDSRILLTQVLVYNSYISETQFRKRKKISHRQLLMHGSSSFFSILSQRGLKLS